MRGLSAVSFLAAVGAVVFGAVPVAASPPAAAARAAEVFVEINPSTVEPGHQVGIRASCPDNKVKATVTASAFGKVTVSPQFGFLTAAVRVPTTVKAGTFTVTLVCADGSRATTSIHVVKVTRPVKGPATGFGGTAKRDASPLLIGGGLVVLLGGLGLGLLSWRRRNA